MHHSLKPDNSVSHYLEPPFLAAWACDLPGNSSSSEVTNYDSSIHVSLLIFVTREFAFDTSYPCAREGLPGASLFPFTLRSSLSELELDPLPLPSLESPLELVSLEPLLELSELFRV